MQIGSLHQVFSWLIASLCSLFLASPAGAHDFIIAGYIENAWFKNGDIIFKAKLDTGAKTSSINAIDTEVYKRGGKKWVRFSLTNADGKPYAIDAPVKRTIRIRRAGTKVSQRLVIELPVCVGGQHHNTDFTLANRKGQNYQILIGREFLAGRILVQSSETFLVSNKCRPEKVNSR